ncbi:MAG: hypothetical protein DMF85_13135 [Acidobacteria bacterium]|nr:MAG: hypothetical protein DMF85_13135 [Acidobacteriota bacterium]PYR80321.1 MAG: hypothetical protein DMF86_01025 [Acidobacteriota bacterium]
MDDQADQAGRTGGQPAAASEPKRDAAADQSDTPTVTRRFVEPAPEADEDLTEAGYGHGV